MPDCLFHYHFNKALGMAVAKLKSKCQEQEGSEDQKAFNIDTQIPLMEQTLKNIQEIEISKHFVNWHQFRSSMVEHIDRTKELAQKNKENKQSACGSNITTEQIINFGNKLLAMFDEMQLEISADNFAMHKDKPENEYTNIDYNKSTFLCQLINLSLEYRFNKIQEKHVENKQKFSSKHIKKWGALNEAIASWQELQAKNFTHLKTTVTGVLHALMREEQKIQNEEGTGYAGFFRGIAGKGLSLYAQDQNSLYNRLSALLERFSTCVEPNFSRSLDNGSSTVNTTANNWG